MKKDLSKRYVLVFFMVLLFLGISLFFVFADDDEMKKNQGSDLEGLPKIETPVGENYSLDQYFKNELVEEKEIKNSQQESLPPEETCDIEGQAVKTGTIVSGVICAGANEK